LSESSIACPTRKYAGIDTLCRRLSAGDCELRCRCKDMKISSTALLK
jgi:hypothetical protein